MAIAAANALININVNTSEAQQQVGRLARSLTTLNAATSTLNRSVYNQSQIADRSANDLMNLANATGYWQASIVKTQSAATRLDQTLSKGQATMGQYLGARFNRNGQEAAAVLDLANRRAAALSTQFVSLGRSGSGLQEAIAIRPLEAFNSATTVSAQKLAIQRAMLMQGTTSMINFGKNVQWAGRQLMVGFTVPLSIFGASTMKTFKEIEMAGVKFKKVYGDIFTSPEEVERNAEALQGLSKEFTKYGIAIKDTLNLGAEAAAAGAQNADLTDAVTQATRLQTLGQMEQAKALETTISLQNAFSLSGQDLADSINYLNMVENQTVVTLQDLADAIPRVAPVIVGLGGDVRDMAVFMAAMQEGGVSAAQGANALKSGLGSLINPTKAAQEQLGQMGININQIVSANRGDLMGTVKAFSAALETVSEFERQQALETLFGKYQYARLGALFANINKEGTQAARALDLANYSSQELAASADKELSIIEDAYSVKLTGAIERFKLAIAPIGEMFTKFLTPLINFATKIAEAFNNLPDFAKNLIGIGTVIVGLVVPAVTMFFGLLMNLIGTLTKFSSVVGIAFKGFVSGGLGGAVRAVGDAFKYMALQELDATNSARQMTNATSLANAALRAQVGGANASGQALQRLELVINRVTNAYMQAAAAARNMSLASSMNYSAGTTAAAMARNLPPATIVPRNARMLPIIARPAGMPPPVPMTPIRRNAGDIVPGMGNKDTVPAMLTPGEFVVNKEATANNLETLHAINSGKAVEFKNKGGIIPGAQYLMAGGVSRAIAPKAIASSMQTSNLPARMPINIVESERESVLQSLNARRVTNPDGSEVYKFTNNPMSTGMTHTLVRNPGGSIDDSLDSFMSYFTKFDYNPNANKRDEFKRLLMFLKKEEEKQANELLAVQKAVGDDFTSPRAQDLLNTLGYRYVDGKLSKYGGVPSILARDVDDILDGLVMGTGGRDNREQLYYNAELEKFIPKTTNANKGGLLGFNKGGMIPGVQYFARPNPLRVVEPRQRDASTVRSYGKSKWQTRGMAPNSIIQEYIYGRLSSRKERAAAARIISSFGSSLSRSVARTAQTIELKHLSPESGLDELLAMKNLPAISQLVETKIHHTHLTRARMYRGNRYVSRYTAGYDALSNLQANQGSLLIKDFIERNLLKNSKRYGKKRYGKYNYIIENAFGENKLTPQQIKKLEDAIDEAIKKRLREIESSGQAKKLADDPKDGAVTFQDTIKPIIDEHIIKAGGDPKAIAKISVRNVPRKNQGGMISGYNDGGNVMKSFISGRVFDSSRKNYVPGVGNKDTVAAALAPGEFVVNKQSTKENLPLLESINNNEPLQFNLGGMISGYNQGGGVATPGRMFYGGNPYAVLVTEHATGFAEALGGSAAQKKLVSEIHKTHLRTEKGKATKSQLNEMIRRSEENPKSKGVNQQVLFARALMESGMDIQAVDDRFIGLSHSFNQDLKNARASSTSAIAAIDKAMASPAEVELGDAFVRAGLDPIQVLTRLKEYFEKNSISKMDDSEFGKIADKLFSETKETAQFAGIYTPSIKDLEQFLSNPANVKKLEDEGYIYKEGKILNSKGEELINYQPSSLKWMNEPKVPKVTVANKGGLISQIPHYMGGALVTARRILSSRRAAVESVVQHMGGGEHRLITGNASLIEQTQRLAGDLSGRKVIRGLMSRRSELQSIDGREISTGITSFRLSKGENDFGDVLPFIQDSSAYKRANFAAEELQKLEDQIKNQARYLRAFKALDGSDIGLANREEIIDSMTRYALGRNIHTPGMPAQFQMVMRSDQPLFHQYIARREGRLDILAKSEQAKAEQLNMPETEAILKESIRRKAQESFKNLDETKAKIKQEQRNLKESREDVMTVILGELSSGSKGLDVAKVTNNATIQSGPALPAHKGGSFPVISSEHEAEAIANLIGNARIEERRIPVGQALTQEAFMDAISRGKVRGDKGEGDLRHLTKKVRNNKKLTKREQMEVDRELKRHIGWKKRTAKLNPNNYFWNDDTKQLEHKVYYVHVGDARSTYDNSIPQSAINFGGSPIRANKGGLINYLNTGGVAELFSSNKVFDSSKDYYVPGVGNTDTVPAMLTAGEFVVNKEATANNLEILHAINNGTIAGVNKGGVIGLNKGGIAGYESGGNVRSDTQEHQERSLESPRRTLTRINLRGRSKDEIALMYGVKPSSIKIAGERAILPRNAQIQLRSPKAVDELVKRDQPTSTTTVVDKALSLGTSVTRFVPKSKISAIGEFFGERPSFTARELAIQAAANVASLRPGERLTAGYFSDDNFGLPITRPDYGQDLGYDWVEPIVDHWTDGTGRWQLDRRGRPYRKQDERQAKVTFRTRSQRAVSPQEQAQTDRSLVKVKGQYYHGNKERLAKKVLGTKFNKGGIIYANDGIKVPGIGSTDTVPAMLTPGEFIINKEATSNNLDLLHAINNGELATANNGKLIKKYNKGGFIFPAVNQYREGSVVERDGQFVVRAPDGTERIYPTKREANRQLKILRSQSPSSMNMKMGGSMGVAMAGMGVMMVGQQMQQKAAERGETSAMGGILSGAGIGLSVYSGIMMLPPQIQAIVAGIAALTGTFAALVLGTKKLNNALVESNNIMMGSTERVNAMGKAFGRETSVQRVAAQRAIAAGGEISQESYGVAGEFIQTDAGKKLIEDMKNVQKMGQDQSKALAAQLSRAILAGAITPEEARSIAIQVGTALKNEKIGAQVSAQITSIFGPNGEKLEKNRLSITSQIIPQVDAEELLEQGEEAAQKLGKIEWTGFNLANAGLSIITLGGTYISEGRKMEMAMRAVSNAVIQATQIEKDARAAVILEYQQGILTIDEYINKINQLNSMNISGQAFEAGVSQAAELAAKASRQPITPEDIMNVDLANKDLPNRGARNTYVPTNEVIKKQAVAIQAIALFDDINASTETMLRDAGVTQKQIDDIRKIAENIGKTTGEDTQLFQSMAIGDFDSTIIEKLKAMSDEELVKIAGDEDPTEFLKNLGAQLDTFSAYPELKSIMFDIGIKEPEKFEQYQKTFLEASRLPDDIKKTFNLNLSTKGGLDRAEDLMPGIKNLEPFLNELQGEERELALSFSVDENGKPIPASELIKEIPKIRKTLKDLESTDPKIKKQAMIEYATYYRDENGNKIDNPEEMVNKLVERYGDKIYDLPPIKVKQVYDLDIEIEGIKEQIAIEKQLLQDAYRTGNKEAQKYHSDRVSMFQGMIKTARDTQSAIIKTSQAPESGGGGGETTLMQDLNKMLKDAQRWLKAMKDFLNKSNPDYKKFIAGPYAPEFLDYLASQGDKAQKLIKQGNDAIMKAYRKFEEVQLTQMTSNAVMARAINPILVERQRSVLEQDLRLSGRRGMTSRRMEAVRSLVGEEQYDAAARIRAIPKKQRTDDQKQALREFEETQRQAIRLSRRQVVIEDRGNIRGSLVEERENLQSLNLLSKEGLSPQMQQDILGLGYSIDTLKNKKILSLIEEQLIRKQLQEVQNKIKETSDEFSKLRHITSQGIDSRTAEEINNLGLSFESIQKLGPAGLKVLQQYIDIQKTFKSLSSGKNQILDLQDSIKSSNIVFDQFGIKSKESFDFIKNLNLSPDALEKNKEAVKELAAAYEYLNNIAQMNIARMKDPLERTLDVLNLQTKTMQEQISAYARNMIKPIEDALEEINDRLSQKQRVIELEERKKEPYQDAIDALEKEKEALQEIHDQRIKALEQVEDINERIARSQRAQLSIASALSRGDIAGAAQAALEAKQEAARDRAGDARRQLQEQNEREIKGKDDLIRQNREKIEAIDKSIKALQLELRGIQDEQYNKQLELNAAKKEQMKLEEKLYKLQLLQSIAQTQQALMQAAKIGDSDAVAQYQEQLKALMSIAGPDPESFFADVGGGKGVIESVQTSLRLSPIDLIYKEMEKMAEAIGLGAKDFKDKIWESINSINFNQYSQDVQNTIGSKLRTLLTNAGASLEEVSQMSIQQLLEKAKLMNIPIESILSAFPTDISQRIWGSIDFKPQMNAVDSSMAILNSQIQLLTLSLGNLVKTFNDAINSLSNIIPGKGVRGKKGQEVDGGQDLLDQSYINNVLAMLSTVPQRAYGIGVNSGTGFISGINTGILSDQTYPYAALQPAIHLLPAWAGAGWNSGNNFVDSIFGGIVGGQPAISDAATGISNTIFGSFSQLPQLASLTAIDYINTLSIINNPNLKNKLISSTTGFFQLLTDMYGNFKLPPTYHDIVTRHYSIVYGSGGGGGDGGGGGGGGAPSSPALSPPAAPYNNWTNVPASDTPDFDRYLRDAGIWNLGGLVSKFAMGGNVRYKGSREPAPGMMYGGLLNFQQGSYVPGIGMTDKVPAMLTPGEFVVRKSVTEKFGPLLEALNGQIFPNMSLGTSLKIQESKNEAGNNMSNYSISVNVEGSNSSADDIAGAVMSKLRMIESRKIRGVRL